MNPPGATRSMREAVSGMSDGLNNKANEDKKIDGLLRASRKGSDDGFIRPSEASIDAYLLGTAAPSQISEVRAALVHSGAFRQELLSMARDLDSLTATQTLGEFNHAAVPEAPSLESTSAPLCSRNEAKKPIIWSWVGGSIVAGMLGDVLGTLLRQCRCRSGRCVAAAGLAGAALLALIIIRAGRIDEFPRSEAAMAEWIEVTRMDPGYFVSNVTRTPDGDRLPALLYSNHMDAAVAEFGRLIRYEGGEYVSDTTGKRMALPEMHRLLLLRLVDEGGNVIAEFAGSVPSQADAEPSIRTWALAIPSGVLLSIDMFADTVSALWSMDLHPRACIAFTYGTDSTYAATNGAVFEFQADHQSDGRIE